MERKAIALIAHDQRKLDMAMFARDHEALLGRFPSSPPGRPGRSSTSGPNSPWNASPQVRWAVTFWKWVPPIAEDKVEAVIFFRDPLTAQPHEPDVSALLRIRDVHQSVGDDLSQGDRQLAGNAGGRDGGVTALRKQVRPYSAERSAHWTQARSPRRSITGLSH